MTLKECMLINNDCYKAAKKIIKPAGIVVHSTGCNNPYLKRYVNPVKSQKYYDEVIADIGKNAYDNHWNHSVAEMKRSVCVHGFIGLNASGEVETYQTLPFNYCCWGVGSGKVGSFNYNPVAHIQFEICEDGLRDETYFNKAMKEAQEFCAYLCKTYSLSAGSICSHAEAYKLGYGSNHNDCDFWLSKFGKDMDWFRDQVETLLSSATQPKQVYRVQVGEYKSRTNAELMMKKLKDLGFNAKIKTV